MNKLRVKDLKELYGTIQDIPMPNESDIQRAEVAALTCKTTQEFAEFLNVDAVVINLWCRKSKRFSQAVESWRDYATREIERALARKAVGFSKKTARDVITKQGTVETLIVETYYPPDTAAAQFWLKNRAPADWKDKSEVDVNVTANIRAWLIEAGDASGDLIDVTPREIEQTSHQALEASPRAFEAKGVPLQPDASPEPVRAPEPPPEIEPRIVSEPEPLAKAKVEVQVAPVVAQQPVPTVPQQSPLQFDNFNDRWGWLQK